MVTMARDRSFDEVAAEYDAVRPSYPAAVFDRIVQFGCFKPNTKALEVGVGTGRATVPLAERGFEIYGLEPGAGLAAVARSNLARFPRVTISTTTFEAWTVARGAFGLAFSAQAFHWLDPGLRLVRFAEALGTDGVLAVFGNVPRVPPGPVRDDLDAAYREFAPSLSSGREAATWYASADSPVMWELAGSQHFRDAEFTAFTWQCTLGAASYGRLLSTYSDHSTLPSDQLRALLTRVAEVVHSHGGSLTLSYTTGLFLARRSN